MQDENFKNLARSIKVCILSKFDKDIKTKFDAKYKFKGKKEIMNKQS